MKLMKTRFSPNLMAFIFIIIYISSYFPNCPLADVASLPQTIESNSVTNSSLIRRVGHCRTIKMCLLKKNVIYLLCGASTFKLS